MQFLDGPAAQRRLAMLVAQSNPIKIALHSGVGRRPRPSDCAQASSNGDCRSFASQREISSSVVWDFFDSIGQSLPKSDVRDISAFPPPQVANQGSSPKSVELLHYSVALPPVRECPHNSSTKKIRGNVIE